MTDRKDILLALALADGQQWHDWANADEHTAEMMYGKQADAVETMLAATDVEQQRLRGDGLAADLGHAVARATDLESRLARINDRAYKWAVVRDGESGYDDPAEALRDCAVIVSHLASGQTFPGDTEGSS